MSGIEDLKTTQSVETEKEVPVEKPETGKILGDSAPDTTTVDKPTTPDTPAAPTPTSTPTATPTATPTPATPEVSKPDTPQTGVTMPVGTPVNPQATEVKSLDKDTSDKDVSTKLTELIKALEFDYPILRQLLP